MFLHPRSERGKIAANAIGIAPRVSGPIKSLPLEDDQAIKKGDLLFEIDSEPYELAVRVTHANRDAVAGEITTSSGRLPHRKRACWHLESSEPDADADHEKAS
jgi:multidrug efflux system membrane fusion protein